MSSRTPGAICELAAAQETCRPAVKSSGDVWTSRSWLRALLALLFAAIPAFAQAAEAEAIIVAGTPRAAIDRDGSLTIAVALFSRGSAVHQVTLKEAELRSGRRVAPAHLPLALGDIDEDAPALVDLRFALHGALQRFYVVELEGRFASLHPHHDADRRHRREDREGEWRHGERDERGDRPGAQRSWHIRITVDLSGAGNVSGTSGSAQGKTQQTFGPYPALPAPGQIEANEDNSAPAPQGLPQVLFAPTPLGHRAADPGITTYPGVTPDGAVPPQGRLSRAKAQKYPVLVLRAPGLRTGARVSSMNSFVDRFRSAIRASKTGRSSNAARPTQSARVDRSRSTPWRL